jgi:type II secretory pathway pseudopilin PulG
MINFKNERGDSLLEVVISAVIMGIIGVLLVSSIATAKPFANKMSLIGQSVQNLNTLAESINLQSYTPCTSTNPQPYIFGQSATNSAASGFAITTNSLPAAMVNTGGHIYQYSSQLSTTGASGSVTWSVEPALPTGLNLNGQSGVISGSTTEPVTGDYTFTATDGSNTATKNLILTSALVIAMVNNGSAWVTCDTVPAASITNVVGDGTNATYTFNNGSFTVGQTLTIWGNSNPAFNSKGAVITSVSGSQFVVANTTTGTGSGGNAGLSPIVNVQQIIVSTSVSGSPLHKVITKALL